MADKPPKSDDDRALEGLAARRDRDRKNAPADGVPVVGHAAEDCTPVGHVLQLIERSELDEDDKRPLKRHVANMALRAARTEPEFMRQQIDELDEKVEGLGKAIVDIRGEHGNNGKLGALKARVDQSESRKWAVLMALVGAVITILTLAVGGGRWIGRIETDVDRLKERAAHRAQGSDNDNRK